MEKIANTVLDLQKRITERVQQLIPSSRVIWRRDYESDCDWVVIVLDLERSQFAQVKSAIREFRPEAEGLGIDILPMVKDVETSRNYYPQAVRRLAGSAWSTEYRTNCESEVAADGWVLAMGEAVAWDLGAVSDESLRMNLNLWDPALIWPTPSVSGPAGIEREGIFHQFFEFPLSFEHSSDCWTNHPAHQMGFNSRSDFGMVQVALGQTDNKPLEQSAVCGMAENEDLALAA